MSDEQPRSPRRLRALPSVPFVPVDDEVQVSAPSSLSAVGEPTEPREPELVALLREVDQLRTSLRADLTLAATAAEAGEGDLAEWLVATDEEVVHGFEERALGHLATLQRKECAVTARRARRGRRMMPAAPLVAAAAAMFGLLAGVVPNLATSPEVASVNAAMESYDELHRLALDGAATDEMVDAAEQLHDDLAPLLAQAKANPAAAEQALALLQSSQAVLVARGGSSLEVQAVLRETRALVASLRAALPRRVGPAVPLVDGQRESPKPKRSAASPKPSASPKPTTSPKPSASPTPSSSSSSSPAASKGPLPPGPRNPLE